MGPAVGQVAPQVRASPSTPVPPPRHVGHIGWDPNNGFDVGGVRAPPPPFHCHRVTPEEGDSDPRGDVTPEEGDGTPGVT